ncbi:universal stress protein [Pseudonocardia hydrocarbonoxydans]|uniref:Universal stress protein n=1 Tax=Pseudonocardia hydrocarbonoxydans TaxID=76726 RepID=A0A4Y3WPR5_9PSEU|nr:universal stress protein [Pseudonocardia hydrocarbonoxydans]GEC20060.1 universal stress protein [Pseudonocardia hydrocarbonoxydans]
MHPSGTRPPAGARVTGARDVRAAGPVVVGVDDTDHARAAVAWAASEAVRLGAPLRLVAATGLVGDHLPGRAGRDRRLHEVLDAARGCAVAAGGGAVATELRTGYPVTVLADESRAARLLVVGDRGTSRIEGVLAGSVAVPLLGRSRCPVVVVRGHPRDPAGLPVVVGVDGTPGDDAVLDVALELAAARGAELVVLHGSGQPPDGPATDLLVGPAVAREVLADLELRSLTEHAVARGAGCGVDVRVVGGSGRAVDLLLAGAPRAQLVVVGSRGRGDLAGLLFGSVSTALVHRADCPVVVVGPLARPVPQAG